MHNVSKEIESIVQAAKEIARQFGQGYVGTEHLLLGLLREKAGLGAAILAEHDITADDAREQVEKLLKERMQETWVMGRLPGTPHFRDVIARAADEARGSGNWQIRSEHLLIALLGEKGSTGYKALKALNLALEQVRKDLARHRTCG